MHLESRESSLIPRCLHEINLDVVTHLIDWVSILQEGTKPVRPRIEVEAIDRCLQMGAAENLLCDALQTSLKIPSDVRRDVLVGDLLLLHQDQRLRLISSRQEPTHPPYSRPTEK